jgi:hypothetical protein
VSVQTNLSRKYREKALEAATKAELAVDPTERQKLIDAATNWSRMADYEEAHFSDPSSHHPKPAAKSEASGVRA